MQDDFSVELGADDERLELPWAAPDGEPRYYDLKRRPELLLHISEAHHNRELAEFLTALNSAGSIFETAKCDTWLSNELSEEELIFGAAWKFGSYVDLVFTEPGHRFAFEQHEQLADGAARLPAPLLPVLRLLLEQIAHLAAAIAALEARIVAAVKAAPALRRLATIPGIGPIVAHAMVAALSDGRQFRAARDFAAWAGLTPQEHASAGKRRAKGISRQGDSRLRKLCALGASTVMRTARAPGARATAWQRGIPTRRPIKVAVLAQAATTARIAWAVLVSGAVDQPRRQASTIAAA